MPQSYKCVCTFNFKRTSGKNNIKTCFCVGKGRRDPCISPETSWWESQSTCSLLLKSRLPENLDTGHGYSYPPRACVQQEEGRTDGGLSTPLQTLNHRSLSSLSTPPLPSSAMYQLSPVLTVYLSANSLFLLKQHNFSTSLAIIISNTDTSLFFLLVLSPTLPTTDPTSTPLPLDLFIARLNVSTTFKYPQCLTST